MILVGYHMHSGACSHARSSKHHHDRDLPHQVQIDDAKECHSISKCDGSGEWSQI